MDKPIKTSYLKNTKASNERTVRLEVIGSVSPQEKEFLDGLALFAAGTMSRNKPEHTRYVSKLMAKLIGSVVNKLKKEREDK